jgi:hypothetical protein
MDVRHLQSWMLALVASAGLLPTGVASAQSHADSAAIMRTLGTALRDEARQVLTTITCYARRNACPPQRLDSANVLMAELARAAAATLVPEGREPFPPCQWGYDPPRTGAGFLVGITGINFSGDGDTARVVVLEKCDNPPGYGHDIFARDFEYQLARRSPSVWDVISKRLMRITQGPAPLPERTVSRLASASSGQQPRAIDTTAVLLAVAATWPTTPAAARDRADIVWHVQSDDSLTFAFAAAIKQPTKPVRPGIRCPARVPPEAGTGYLRRLEFKVGTPERILVSVVTTCTPSTPSTHVVWGVDLFAVVRRDGTWSAKYAGSAVS